MRRLRGPYVAILIAIAAFALFDAALFVVPLYRDVLDPSSSTGSFERAVDTLRGFPADRTRDVLVVGDSRIYSGLDPATASTASGGLRFLDGSVPGTTPRCWYVFLKAIDPRADRFRAIVIPVDTYADDDSAIGSVDGNDRFMDLRYVVFSAQPRDVVKIAASFSGLRAKLTNGLDLLLRGPVLRDDVQAFGAAPAARARAIADAHASSNPYDPLASHPRTESLKGMRVDFHTDRIAYPSSVATAERPDIELQVLKRAGPSDSYARYRRDWLYAMVERYAAAGIPVIFVRIPTRPAHRFTTSPLTGSLLDLQRRWGSIFLPSAPYLALERPELFADHDHLNRDGSKGFSRLLGADVARALQRVTRAAGVAPVSEGDLQTVLSTVREAIGIGIPLQFQSYEFWVFLAVVSAIFYAAPKRARIPILLCASYYFYARWNAWYLLFLLILTASDFAIALAIVRSAGVRRKALLTGGVAANLAFLASFKYANFATGTASALLGLHDDPWLVSLIVPIGISFHTFQSISYLVDVHRGKTPAIRNALDYALYLAFFPQLLSGPIVRAGLFFGELFSWRSPTAEDVSYGLARATFGLFKKIGIADQFSPISDAYFSAVRAHPGALAAWCAVFAFSMQIYFDFSGYSDIAIGCARLFGFVFPENFNLPYLATSVTDFWHRWHMTLSTWLRDYLYIPLGGSRHGKVETVRNLMLTMLLGGLWHGANWTFVAWGGVHGVLLSLERALGIGRENDARLDRWLRASRALLTFAVVSLAWVLFRAQRFDTAIDVYRALFAGGPGPWMLSGWSAVLASVLAIFALARIALGDRPLTVSWSRLTPSLQAISFVALLAGIELLSYPGAPATFIYFKF
ncbi:MAG: MBOAT family protein [Candidatus Eremiobacteraeota bacterium]|nr:MBOAT family protein [Candidatus Eremiobacteraeota bacterium]